MLQPHKVYVTNDPNQLNVELASGSFYPGRARNIKCTLEQYKQGIAKYRAGAYIQDAFDFLSPDDREFLQSGTTPEEWANIFPPEFDDEPPF